MSTELYLGLFGVARMAVDRRLSRSRKGVVESRLRVGPDPVTTPEICFEGLFAALGGVACRVFTRRQG